MELRIIQNCLIGLNIIFTLGSTWYFHHRVTRNNQKKFLDEKLFKLQEFSLKYPFLENPNFCSSWDTLKERFTKEELSNEELEKFLQYDVYTEILFNYIEESYKFYKSEEKMLNHIDFKSWVRIHSACWKNSLSAHSNHDTYEKEVCEIIDHWLK